MIPVNVYWKNNFPMTWSFRASVGWSVGWLSVCRNFPTERPSYLSWTILSDLRAIQLTDQSVTPAGLQTVRLNLP